MCCCRVDKSLANVSFRTYYTSLTFTNYMHLKLMNTFLYTKGKDKGPE